jgi:hypothetical protein
MSKPTGNRKDGFKSSQPLINPSEQENPPNSERTKSKRISMTNLSPFSSNTLTRDTYNAITNKYNMNSNSNTI